MFLDAVAVLPCGCLVPISRHVMATSSPVMAELLASEATFELDDQQRQKVPLPAALGVDHAAWREVLTALHLPFGSEVPPMTDLAGVEAAARALGVDVLEKAAARRAAYQQATTLSPAEFVARFPRWVDGAAEIRRLLRLSSFSVRTSVFRDLGILYRLPAQAVHLAMEHDKGCGADPDYSWARLMTPGDWALMHGVTYWRHEIDPPRRTVGFSALPDSVETLARPVGASGRWVAHRVSDGDVGATYEVVFGAPHPDGLVRLDDALALRFSPGEVAVRWMRRSRKRSRQPITLRVLGAPAFDPAFLGPIQEILLAEERPGGDLIVGPLAVPADDDFRVRVNVTH